MRYLTTSVYVLSHIQEKEHYTLGLMAHLRCLLRRDAKGLRLSQRTLLGRCWLTCLGYSNLHPRLDHSAIHRLHSGLELELVFSPSLDARRKEEEFRCLIVLASVPTYNVGYSHFPKLCHIPGGTIIRTVGRFKVPGWNNHRQNEDAMREGSVEANPYW